jgi:Putative MetA-pathway of phenol degradation
MNARRKTRLSTRLAAAGVVLMTLAAALPAPAATLSYTGSVQFSQGNYFFDLTTRGVCFINGLSLAAGRFTLSASLPLIYQSTPYVSYSGVGVLPSGGAESSSVNQRQGKETVVLPEPVDVRQYGVGDPLVRLGIRLTKESAAGPSLEAVAQVKAPVARLDSGFGTGEWDYGAGLALSKRIGGAVLFADASYWMLGDLPELELKDPWVYSVSLGLPFSRGRSSLLVSYFGMSRVIEGAAPASSLGLGLSLKVGTGSSLMLNAGFGLSESSPDLALSLGWAIGL